MKQKLSLIYQENIMEVNEKLASSYNGKGGSEPQIGVVRKRIT